MANTQKFIAEVHLNGRPAINNLDKLEKGIKNLEKEAKRLKKAGDITGAEQAKKKQEELKKVVAATKAEVKSVESAFSTTGKSVAGLENALKLATEKWRRLTNEADRNKMALRIREIKNELNRVNSTLDVTTSKSRHAFGALAQRAAEYTGMYMLFNRSRQLIQNAIQGNLALSDSISDIQKVSGLSEEAVKGLVTQIEKIDSRNAPEVLNNMAYAAGKLGIKGAENLLGFTRAADKLNVALKEYLGDGAEGVVKLMKFANVMGTTDQYGVEQALIKTGSALNYMTQSTAAAADYMIEFAGRFGPIARQARMTSGDVIGLASALDALTVNNEEAATALQRFVVRLLSAPTAVSKALGMDAQLSKQMVETGKSIELVEMALGKLAERSQKYGVSGISSVIGDISKGQAQRLIKTLATLSNNTEMVSQYVSMANQAFEEGTSVIDEYNIKNQNAAAIMERMKNSWTKLMVNAEEVGVVKDLAIQLYNLSNGIQNSNTAAAMFKGTLSAVLEVLMFLVRTLNLLSPILVAILGLKFVHIIGGWTTALWSMVAGLNAATFSASKLRAALIQTGWGVVAVVIGLAVNELVKWVSAEIEANKKTEEFNKKIKDLTTNLEDYNKELYKEQRAMDDLFAKAKAANGQSDERKRLIAEINAKYGKYLSNLLSEKSTVEDIAAAQKEANKQLRESIALRIKEGKLSEVRETFAEKGATGLESFRSGVETTGMGTDDIVKAQKQIQELLRNNYGKSGYGGPNQATVTILKELAKQDNRWNMVLNNRRDVGSMQDFLVESKKRGKNYYGADPISTAQREAAYKAEKEMVEANRRAYQGIADYVSSVIEMTNAERKINEKYDPLIGDLLNQPEPEPINTTVIEPEPTGPKGSKTDKELQDAKQDVQAIKSQLTAFYEWRDSEINKMRDRGEITETVKDMMIEANKSLHAASEMNAWNYLLQKEGAKEAWEVQLQTMKTEIMNSNPQMQEIWNYVSEVNMEALGNTLQRLGSQEVGGMEKTIAQDADIIAKHTAKLAQTIQKELEKYNYEQAVRTKFVGTLTQLGLFATQWDKGVTDYFKNATEAADAAMKELSMIATQAFTFDIDTEEGEQKFREALDNCKYLAIDAAKMTKEQILLMYEQVVELGDQMDEAIRKHYQKEKKRQDTRFRGAGYTDEEKQIDKSLESKGKQQKAGIGQSLAQQIGLGGIMTDPEVQRIQNRIYWRNLEYEDAKKRLEQMKALQDQELENLRQKGASEQEIENLRMQYKQENQAMEMLMQERQTSMIQETENLTAQIAQQMKARTESIKTLIKPVTDFTEAAGRKIGDMIFKMESEEATWEELWKNMALAVGESVIQMTAQYAENLIMQQAMNRASEADQMAHTTSAVTMGIAEGSAKTIGKLGWWGIPLVAVISALLMGLLQSALSTSSKTSSSSNSNTKNNLRLVKGMLTYDEGNVQTFQQAREGGAYTVLGNDGRVYSARKQSELKTGIVKSPIATMVNGQPSLVAERGPEMVIGRRTLRDMTLFRPDLVQQIIKFDRNRRHGFRTYDEGNLDELALQTSNLQPQTSNQSDLLAALQESKAVNEQTAMAVGALVAELRRGIGVRKYGTGGLVEEVIDGLYTTKKKNTSPMLRRLLGS